MRTVRSIRSNGFYSIYESVKFLLLIRLPSKKKKKKYMSLVLYIIYIFFKFIIKGIEKNKADLFKFFFFPKLLVFI